MTLLDVVRDPRSKVPSLVTEYVKNYDVFNVTNNKITDFDARYYTLELLKVHLLSWPRWIVADLSIRLGVRFLSF